jgi:hypothetical protein
LGCCTAIHRPLGLADSASHETCCRCPGRSDSRVIIGGVSCWTHAAAPFRSIPQALADTGDAPKSSSGVGPWTLDDGAQPQSATTIRLFARPLQWGRAINSRLGAPLSRQQVIGTKTIPRCPLSRSRALILRNLAALVNLNERVSLGPRATYKNQLHCRLRLESNKVPGHSSRVSSID